MKKTLFSYGTVFATAILLLCTACGSTPASIWLPVAAGQAELIAITDSDGFVAQAIQFTAPAEQKEYYEVQADENTAYYQLTDGVTAAVAVLSATSAGTAQAPMSGQPFESMYPGLNVTINELGGLVYVSCITDGERVLELRFYQHVELTEGCVKLYGGGSLPLGLTREALTAYLDSMELDALFLK